MQTEPSCQLLHECAPARAIDRTIGTQVRRLPAVHAAEAVATECSRPRGEEFGHVRASLEPTPETRQEPDRSAAAPFNITSQSGKALRGRGLGLGRSRGTATTVWALPRQSEHCNYGRGLPTVAVAAWGCAALRWRVEVGVEVGVGVGAHPRPPPRRASAAPRPTQAATATAGRPRPWLQYPDCGGSAQTVVAVPRPQLRPRPRPRSASPPARRAA